MREQSASAPSSIAATLDYRRVQANVERTDGQTDCQPTLFLLGVVLTRLGFGLLHAMTDDSTLYILYCCYVML